MQVVHAGAGEALAGLVGANPGLADEDDLAVMSGGQLGGVLTNKVERQVVGAGDVGGLELSGAADVEDGNGGGVSHPVDDGGGVDLGGGQW